MVKNNLERRDRVIVNGTLGYKPQVDQNGQNKFAGHIEAQQILKVDRFSEAVNDATIEKSVHSASE